MTDLTLNAMIRLRSEIAGRIEHHQEEATRAARELGHVDAVLQILSPGIELGAIRTKPFPARHVKRKNGAARLIQTVMRENPQSMTVEEIVEALIESGKLGAADAAERNVLVHRVGNSLYRLKMRKRAVAIPQDVGAQRWRLT